MPVQWWAKSPLEAIQTAKFNAPQMMMDARTAALNQQLIPQQVEAARLANQRFGAVTPLELQRMGLENQKNQFGFQQQQIGEMAGGVTNGEEAEQLIRQNPAFGASALQGGQRALLSRMSFPGQIAQQKVGLQALGVQPMEVENTGSRGPAVPKPPITSMQGAMGVNPSLPGSSVEGDFTDQAFGTMDQATKRWLIQGLQSQGAKDSNGAPISERSSPQAVAQAVRSWQAAEGQKLMPGVNTDPSKLGEWIAARTEAANKMPAAMRLAVEDLVKAGQGNRGAQLGQAGTAQGLSTWDSAEKGRQNAAQALGLSPDNLGPAGDPAATKKGQALVTRGASYHALKVQVEDLAENLPTLLDPKNKGALDQQMASVTRLVNKMAGASGTEGAMEMSLMEAGIPRSLIDAKGVGEAVKIWYTQNPTLRATALRELPDILYKNTMAPDYEAVGGNPNAWKRKLDGSPAAGGLKTGERRTKGGVTAEWNGTSWVRVK